MRIKTLVAASLVVFSVTLRADNENDWRRVERFARGEVVAVETRAGARFRGQLIRADADSILLYSPAVDSVKLKPIEQLIRRDARLLEDVDRVPLLIEDGDVRIAADGISRKGVHVAEFNELFSAIERDSVLSVVQPQAERPSAWGTVAGLAVGGAIGWASGIMIALRDDGRCSPSCGVRNLEVGVAWVGTPILGGVLGQRLLKPSGDLVIYRR
jgi:hypothetical protein